MILDVRISSPEITLQKDTATPPSVSDLPPGRIIRAKVLDSLAGNRVQLLVAGQKMTVKTGLPLAQGTEVLLETVRENGTLSFRLASSPSPHATTPAPNSNSGISASLARFFEQINTDLPGLGKTQIPVIKTLLGNLALKSGVRDDQFLTKLIENMGLSLERKLESFLADTRGQTGGPMVKQELKSAILQFLSADATKGNTVAMKDIFAVLEKPIDSFLASLQEGKPAADGFARQELKSVIMQFVSADATGDKASGVRDISGTLDRTLDTFVAGIRGQGGAVPAMDSLVKQDLKAAVLHLMAMAVDEDGGGQMKGVSNALENFQQLNTQVGDSNRFLLPFPVFAGEWFDFGQLLIDTGKKGSDGEESENRVIRIAFLMKMTALGNIRAEFSILKKEISGRFMLEDRETSDYIRSLLPELESRLALINYSVKKIDCCVAPPKDFFPDVLLQSMVPPSENSGFNLVV